MLDDPYEDCVVCGDLVNATKNEETCVGCGETICEHCIGTEKAYRHELKCEGIKNKEMGKYLANLGYPQKPKRQTVKSVDRSES